MERKHPDRQLFDFLGGKLDGQASAPVQDHLAQCEDCAAFVRLIGALKAEAGEMSVKEAPSPHLDVSALASLFYAAGPQPEHPEAAAHLATCRECAGELAEYARAEQLAASYTQFGEVSGEAVALAWQKIHDWEESSFAQLKPAAEGITEEMLAKLSELVSVKKDHLRDLAHEAEADAVSTAQKPELVPVIVVDKEGDLRGVELFEKTADPRGASILRHSEGSERFDSKPVHALLDFGEKNVVVVSDQMRQDTIRLQRVTRRDTDLQRADYFIIDD